MKHAKNTNTKSPAAPELPPEVRPGQSIELLKELHILTRDGKLNQDSRRKLKQVYHLFQFIEPLLQELSRPADGGAEPGVAGEEEERRRQRDAADRGRQRERPPLGEPVPLAPQVVDDRAAEHEPERDRRLPHHAGRVAG